MDNDTTGKIPVVDNYGKDEHTRPLHIEASKGGSKWSKLHLDDYDNDLTTPLSTQGNYEEPNVLPETWLAHVANKGVVSGKLLYTYLNEVGHDKLTLYTDTKGNVFVLALSQPKDIKVLGIANKGETGIYPASELVSVRKNDGFILMEPYFLTPDNFIRDYTESKDKTYNGNIITDVICISSMVMLVFISMFVLRHTYQLSPAYLLAVFVPGLIAVLTTTDLKERLAAGMGTATVIGVSLYTSGMFS